MQAEGPFAHNADENSNQSREPVPLVTETVVRTRLIDIPSTLQNLKELKSGQVVNLQLFPDAEYRARVRKVSGNVMGTVAVTADIEAYHSASLIAVVTEGRFLITINIPSERKNYIIKYDFEAESYRVEETLTEELPCEKGRPLPPASNGG